MKIGFDNKFERRLSILVVGLALLWIGSGIIFSKKHLPDIADYHADLAIPTVKIKNISVEKKELFTKVYGVVDSDNVSTIKAETYGKVVKIYQQEGVIIHKDDIILEIDNRKQKQALERASSLLKQREIEYESEKELIEKNYSSKLKLAVALANLKEAEQMFINADVDLGNTVIKAHLDGILDKIQYNVGDFINLYSPIAKIYTSGDYIAYTFVSEKQILAIKLGNDADVVFPSKKIYKGKIKFVSTVAEPETKTYRVEVAFKAEEAATLGMSVVLSIPTYEEYAYFIDNNSLFLNDDGRLGIKIINQDNIIKFIPVKLLSEDKGGFWVKAELDDYPTSINIVTLGGNAVKDGEKVSF